MKERKGAQQGKVLPAALGEADAGIDDEAAALDAGRDRRLDPGLDLIEDVERHIVVAGRDIHLRRLAPLMHQHDARAARRGHREALGIVAEGRYVIDDIDTPGEGRAHDGGMASIDRKPQPGMLAAPPREALQDRLDAADLGRRIDGGGAGSGQFPADVQDRSPGTGT